MLSMEKQQLLDFAEKYAIINTKDVQEQVFAMQKKELLNKHPYSIWESKDGKWHTYLPDEKKGRVPRRRNTQKEIEDLIIDYWKKLEEKPKTFDEVYYSWRKKYDLSLGHNSIAKYNTDYKRYFQETEFSKMSITSITEEDVKVFMLSTVKRLKLCKKACKTLFGYVKNTFHSAKINNLIEIEPTNSLTAKMFYKYCTERVRPKESLVISPDNIKALYERFNQDYNEQPSYIPTYAVHMAMLTGMRVGELSALRWDAITEDFILIDKSEKYDRQTKQYYIDSTKNEKIRMFPVTAEIKKLLGQIKSVEMQCGYICEWVFANEKGRIHAPVISSCSKNKCRQLGITDLGIHAYRRTFNSKMKCEGVPTVVAASLLGHTEEVNEQYYTYDITDIKKKATIVAHLNNEMVSNS